MSQAVTTINGSSGTPYERFRPTPWLWALVVLYVLFQGTAVGTMAFIGGPPHVSLPGIAFFLLVVVVPALALILVRIVQEIRIDADTLQWRTWRGWVSVPWNDVSDYYQLNQKEQEVNFVECVVVTPAGKCSFVSGGPRAWSRSDVLKSHIMRRALSARAEDWGTFGARPELDWPRTFDYKTPTHRWALPLIIVLSVACSAFVIGMAVPMTGVITRHEMSGPGWGWNLGSLIFLSPLYVVALFPLMAFFATVALMRTWNSCITLSEEGLTFSGLRREVSARWSEVTAVKTVLGGMRIIVKTTQGSFAIFCSIRDYYSVRAALRLMTANAALASLNRYAPGQSDPSSSPRMERSEANGSRLFTYRTPNLTSLLRVMTLICIPFCVPMLPGIRQNLPIEPSRLFVVWGCLLVTVTLFGWWRYFAAKIVTDDEGITQQTLFGPKHIRWADVEAVQVKGVDISTRIAVVGANERIRFSTLIRDSEDLIAEIERHTNRTLGL